MAKHSSGRSNFALSEGLVWAIACVIALALCFAAFQHFRVSTEAEERAMQPRCSAGTLTLNVATLEGTDIAVVQRLIDEYARRAPVVRDYCVEPQLVGDVHQAGVIVAAGQRAQVADELAVLGLKEATDKWPVAMSAPASTFIIPLAATGSISEEQARAGADFAKASEQSEQSAR